MTVIPLLVFGVVFVLFSRIVLTEPDQQPPAQPPAEKSAEETLVKAFLDFLSDQKKQ